MIRLAGGVSDFWWETESTTRLDEWLTNRAILDSQQPIGRLSPQQGDVDDWEAGCCWGWAVAVDVTAHGQGRGQRRGSAAGSVLPRGELWRVPGTRTGHGVAESAPRSGRAALPWPARCCCAPLLRSPAAGLSVRVGVAVRDLVFHHHSVMFFESSPSVFSTVSSGLSRLSVAHHRCCEPSDCTTRSSVVHPRGGPEPPHLARGGRRCRCR